MDYKYIIYGAGKRGKLLLDLIGIEQVLAFADSNSSKIGKNYCGLPIINIEMMKSITDQFICIISPFIDSKKIERLLQVNGIKNYLYFNAVDNMFVSQKRQICEKLKYLCCNQKNIGICRIGVASLIVYDFLKELKYNPVLIPENKEEFEHFKFLKEKYNICDFEDATQSCEIFVYAESYIKDLWLEKIKNNKILFNIKEIYEDAYESKTDVLKYKNIHIGKRCFIVATGSSLKASDLEILAKNNEICISMNRIYNIFKKTSWRPDYYIIQDLVMIEDLKETIAKLDLPQKFISDKAKSYWEQKDIRGSIKFTLDSSIDMGHEPFFSDKVDKCLYEGMTVTYAALQLAVYMGFQEIYLLGVDNSYSKNFRDVTNHFEGYQDDKSDVRINQPYEKQNELAYQAAKSYAKKHGIQIYNATRGGKLEVFERVELDSLFEREK